jgi:hypothetical protein
MPTPYAQALAYMQANPTTSAAIALAKGILSLYNPTHAFSAGEVLRPLDARNTEVALAMFGSYGKHGESEGLLDAGRWVVAHYPELIELSDAMRKARAACREAWANQQDAPAAAG